MPPRSRTAKPPKTIDDTEADPSVEPSVDPSVDPLDAVAALLEAIDDPTGQEVLLFELEAGGKRAMLARAGVAEFDVWKFMEDFGGGDYELRLRDVNTKKFGASRRFSISKRVPRKDSTRPATPASPAAGTAGPSHDLLTQMLLAQMNNNAQIVTAALSRTQPTGDALKFTDVLALGKILSERSVTPATPIGELVSAFKTMRDELGGGGPAAASDEVELAKAFAPVLGELMRSSNTGRPAPTPPQQPRRVEIRQPRGQLPTRGHQAASAAGTPPAAPPPEPPAAAPQPAPEPAAPREITPEENTLRALAGIVLTALMFPDGTDLGYRVTLTMDADALGALLEEIQPGALGAQLLRVAPADVRPMIDRPEVHQVLAQLETFLRAEITDDDENDDDENDDAGELAGPAPGAPTNDA